MVMQPCIIKCSHFLIYTFFLLNYIRNYEYSNFVCYMACFLIFAFNGLLYFFLSFLIFSAKFLLLVKKGEGLCLLPRFSLFLISTFLPLDGIKFFWGNCLYSAICKVFGISCHDVVGMNGFCCRALYCIFKVFPFHMNGIFQNFFIKRCKTK